MHPGAHALVSGVLSNLAYTSEVTRHEDLSDAAMVDVYEVHASLVFDGSREDIEVFFGSDADDVWGSVFDGDMEGTVTDFHGFFVEDVPDRLEFINAFTEVSPDFGSAAAALLDAEGVLGKTLIVNTIFTRKAFAGHRLTARILSEVEDDLGADTTSLYVAPLGLNRRSMNGIMGRNAKKGAALAALKSYYHSLGFVGRDEDALDVLRRCPSSWMDDGFFQRRGGFVSRLFRKAGRA